MLPACQLKPLVAPEDAALAGHVLARMDPWLALGYSNAVLERYLLRHDPGLHRYLVCADNSVIGVLAVRYPWLRGPYIEVIALDSQHQGRGLGRALIDWVEHQAIAEAANLWVVVSAFNAPALRFYRRNGFQEIGLLTDLIVTGQDERLLRKPLGKAHEIQHVDDMTE